MKTEKLRQLDSRELEQQLSGIPEQLFRLRFQMSMGQTDGLKKLRELRKDRARIRTILNERSRQADGK